MFTESTKPVTKSEALQMVTHMIDKPGIIDVPELMELFAWQNKLLLWVLKEKQRNHQTKGEHIL